jgi:hypothetical protein
LEAFKDFMSCPFHPPIARGMKWSSSYTIASFGSKPTRASSVLFRACVYEVGGRTVVVQPETQIVLETFACVTSEENTPGGSLKGERGTVGGAAGAVACAAGGCCRPAHPDKTAIAKRRVKSTRASRYGRRGESPYVRIALGLGRRLEIYTGLVVHDTPGRRVSPLSKAR